MDTSSSTGSASEKLSEGEETPNSPSKGDNAPDEPMVGSPPLFTAIPSTSAMMITSDIQSSSCHDIVGHTEGLLTIY